MSDVRISEHGLTDDDVLVFTRAFGCTRHSGSEAGRGDCLNCIENGLVAFDKHRRAPSRAPARCAEAPRGEGRSQKPDVYGIEWTGGGGRTPVLLSGRLGPLSAMEAMIGAGGDLDADLYRIVPLYREAPRDAAPPTAPSDVAHNMGLLAGFCRAMRQQKNPYTYAWWTEKAQWCDDAVAALCAARGEPKKLPFVAADVGVVAKPFAGVEEYCVRVGHWTKDRAEAERFRWRLIELTATPEREPGAASPEGK